MSSTDFPPAPTTVLRFICGGSSRGVGSVAGGVVQGRKGMVVVGREGAETQEGGGGAERWVSPPTADGAAAAAAITAATAVQLSPTAAAAAPCAHKGLGQRHDVVGLRLR